VAKVVTACYGETEDSAATVAVIRVCHDRRLSLRYWLKGELIFKRARCAWVPPDIAALM